MWRGGDEPVQRVFDRAWLPLAGAAGAPLEAFLDKDRRQGFDMGVAPLTLFEQKILLITCFRFPSLYDCVREYDESL